MTRAIQVLPPALASQIAAGEVVERPASVVKELVENALDAGARRVEVTIEAGGIGRIEISDDGHGMGPEDAALSIARHATSKLRAFSDLEELVSYGFRGEALASIASVSHFSLITRSHAQDGGTELRLLGHGTVPDAEPERGAELKPVGAPVGTSIVVADLFFNVPARRKFLRSTGTESGHVSDVVEQAALCRPDVAFSLKRDGRVVRNYARAQSRAERVAQVLEGEKLHRLAGTRGPLSVEAFLSPPERARQGAGALSVVLNGRPIKDRSLCATIAHAYGSLLERGRYPRGVVYLELAPRLVDVNVHPQKTEVRFADQRAVSDALYSVVAQGLVSAFSGGKPQKQPAPPAPSNATAVTDPIVAAAEPSARRSSNWTHEKSPARVVFKDRAAALPEARGEAYELADSGWKRLRFVARVRGRFLVCEGEDGLYVLDAEATRAAVLRFELSRDFAAGALGNQSLLFPVTLEATPVTVALIEPLSPLAAQLGLELRTRGPLALSVHSIPTRLLRLAPEVVVQAYLAELGPNLTAPDIAARTIGRWVTAALEQTREPANESETRGLVSTFSRLELSEAARSRVVLSVTPLGATPPKPEAS